VLFRGFGLRLGKLTRNGSKRADATRLRLKVCPETLSWIAKLSRNDAD
jgi:hypothetical protein